MSQNVGRQIVRKPVEFNLAKEEDYLAYQYVMRLSNFAGAVKKGFADAERKRRAGLKNAQHSPAQHRAGQ